MHLVFNATSDWITSNNCDSIRKVIPNVRPISLKTRLLPSLKQDGNNIMSGLIKKNCTIPVQSRLLHQPGTMSIHV